MSCCRCFKIAQYISDPIIFYLLQSYLNPETRHGTWGLGNESSITAGLLLLSSSSFRYYQVVGCEAQALLHVAYI